MQASLSNLTKYCACHEKSFSWWILVTYATSFTLRGARDIKHQRHPILCLPRKMSLAIDHRHMWTVFTLRAATDVILQPHQILRLSAKLSHMLYPRHTWNVLYNARSNKCHPPTSPNPAPATQQDSSLLPVTHETSFTMRGATGVTLPYKPVKTISCLLGNS